VRSAGRWSGPLLALPLVGCDEGAAGLAAAVGLVVLAGLGAAAVVGRRRVAPPPPGPGQPRSSAECQPVVDAVRGAAGRAGPAAPPPDARLRFVTGQLQAHQRGCLRYELRLAQVEHNLGAPEVRALIGGEDFLLAAPTLILFDHNIVWKRGELEELVRLAAGPLGLEVAEGRGSIDTRAHEACRAWARAEAARLVGPLVAGGSGGDGA
jgi:hypothetical protein